jgi:multidrug efflux pump subunit AcrA (membrane-fusion protein)
MLVRVSPSSPLLCALSLGLAGLLGTACADPARGNPETAAGAGTVLPATTGADPADLPPILDPDKPPVPWGEPVRGTFEDEILLSGELKAVRATTVVAPETSIFQMRIQYLPDEGVEVKAGDPLVDFDNSALADRALDLETQILDAKTQIAAKQAEIATALLDLELERTQTKHDSDRALVRVEVDPQILSRKDYAERKFDADKAALNLADVDKRIKETKARGQAELDVLIIDKEKLERDLQSVRKDLEVLSVKAPINGLVVYEYQDNSQTKWKEGDSVWPGQPVVNLPDLSEMQVVFEVSEVDVPRLAVGVPVELTVDSLPDRKLAGTIVEVPSMAVTRMQDSKVRIFRVRSSLSETLKGVMKPGMSVLGRIKMEDVPNALLVPRASVVERDGRAFMLAKDAGKGKPGWREIKPVARNARYYQVEATS